MTNDKHTITAGRFLVIELESGNTELLNRSDLNVRLQQIQLKQFALIDLKQILDQFDEKAPSRQEFKLQEVAIMTQEKAPTIHSWIKAGVLTPSIRDRDGTRGKAMKFSRTDAFVACVLASLRRKAGLPLHKLNGVGTVIHAARPYDDRRLRKRATPQSKRQSKVSKGV